MNKDNEKHFGIRVDGDILAKFRYACGYVGRSANSQIIQLMLKFIADYEKEHGKINLRAHIINNAEFGQQIRQGVGFCRHN